MKKSNFHLNKWYLDFVGTNGEAIICYSAILSWHGFSVNYTSLIEKYPGKEVQSKSHFHHAHLPRKTDRTITWADDRFQISGRWEASTEAIDSRLVDSEKGYLDWHCFQPASKVHLKIEGKTLHGEGYAEQLVLTVIPWYIPMKELRWGRFHSLESTVVWIEIRDQDKKQWLWVNGKPVLDCSIENEIISSKDKNFQLRLNGERVLESEKKIFQVVEKLLKFLPGFNKMMPVKFLMADNRKWLSKGKLENDDLAVETGIAIHEWVNFNPQIS